MHRNGSNGCCKPYCLCRHCRERRMAERLRKMRNNNGSCMPSGLCRPPPLSNPCCDCGMPDFDPCPGLSKRMPDCCPVNNQQACLCLGGPGAMGAGMPCPGLAVGGMAGGPLSTYPDAAIPGLTGIAPAGPGLALGTAAGGPLAAYPTAGIPGLTGIANLTPDGRLEAGPIAGYPAAATQGALALTGYASADPQAAVLRSMAVPGYTAAGLAGPSAIPGFPDGTLVAPDGRLISPETLNQLSAANIMPGVGSGGPFLQSSGHIMKASGRFMQKEQVTTLGIFGLAGIPGLAAAVPGIGKSPAAKKTKGFQFLSFFTEAVAILAFFIIATITFWMTVIYYAYKLAIKLYYSDRSVQVATFLVIGLLVISTICSIPYGTQPPRTKHMKRRDVMKVEVKTSAPHPPPAPPSDSTEFHIRSIEQVATCPRVDGFFMRYFGWMFFWKNDEKICETSRTFFDLRLQRPECPPGKKTFFCRNFRWLPFVKKDGPEERSSLSHYTSWLTSPWKKQTKREPYAIFTHFRREPQKTSKLRTLFSWLPFIGKKESKSQPYAIITYISPKHYLRGKEEKGYFSWKAKKSSKKKRKKSSWWPFSREPAQKPYAIVTYFREPKLKKTSSSWLPFGKGREQKPYTIVSYFKEPKSKKKSSSSSWLSFGKKPHGITSYFTSGKQSHKEPYAVVKYFSGDKSKKKGKKRKKPSKDRYNVLAHYMSLRKKPAKQPYAIVAYFTASRKKEPYAIVAYFTPKKKSKKQPYPLTAYFTSKRPLTRIEMQKTTNSFVRYFSRQQECNFMCRYFSWLPFTSSKKNQPYAIASYFTAKKKKSRKKGSFFSFGKSHRSSSNFDFFKAKPKKRSLFSLPFGRSAKRGKSMRRSQCNFFCGYFNWLPPHLRDEYVCSPAKVFCIFGPKAECSKKRQFSRWLPSLSMHKMHSGGPHRSHHHSLAPNTIRFGRKRNCGCGAYACPHECNLRCRYFSWLPFYPKVKVNNITLTITDDTAREVYKQSKLYAIPMELKQPPAVLVYLRDTMLGA